MTAEWSIDGAAGELIIGNTHWPVGEAPRGVVVIAHGFKGYKDYGMFPRIAETLSALGLIAHRFNFSHSGMTSNVDTFERPDLFEADTWNKQVHDVGAVMKAVAAGSLDGRGLPLILFGHSRGGVTTLLTAGRHIPPAGVVTASAPSFCNAMTKDHADELLDTGFLVSPSSRTAQDLRIGRAFLVEQLDNPEAHDLLAQSARITCPVLVVHGEKDPTVPAFCSNAIAQAIGDNARVEIIPEADHVYNTPNPLPSDADPSPQLKRLLRVTGDFALDCCP